MKSTAALILAVWAAFMPSAVAAPRGDTTLTDRGRTAGSARSSAKTDTSLLSVLKKSNGYWQIGYEHISNFPYDFSDDDLFAGPETSIARMRSKNLIPAAVHALSEKPVTMKGYMMPIDFDEGVVRSFVLVPSMQACCYGVPPAMNEIVYVTMKGGEGTKYIKDMLIEVSGNITVGENIYGESVFALYRIAADKIEINKEALALRDEIEQLQKSLLKKK